MALFENMLKSNESLFIDEGVLDFNYLPKIMRYREKQQMYIAECINPLFGGRSGKNLLITGRPGIGKTAALRFVLDELEEKSDDIFCIYINCWKENTGYKIMTHICEVIGHKWVQNKGVNELLKECSRIINKNKAVIVLDEVDKLQEKDVIYNLIDEIKKKCIFLITNDVNFLAFLDNRIRSRLLAEVINFKEYNLQETEGILKQRKDLAFVKDVWDKNAFKAVVNKCYALKDIRSGLFLMRESGNLAENENSRRILLKHSNEGIEKLSKYKLRDSLDFNKNDSYVLNLIRDNSGKKCIEIYDLYKKTGGDKGYRTFKRIIIKLEESGVVSLEERNEGTIVNYGSLK